MIWLAILAILIAVLVFTVKVTRTPNTAFSGLAAAMLLGLAGYALQGHPLLPGAPSTPHAADPENPGILVDLRRKVTNSTIPPLNRWVILSDALMRNGEYADAAGILRGATEEDPKSSEAWLALGNALLMHAQGFPSPAVLYAYQRAATADPKAPGPPFFIGLAQASSGKFDQARTTWATLLQHAPEGAPWKSLVEQQLNHVERAISARSGVQPRS